MQEILGHRAAMRIRKIRTLGRIRRMAGHRHHRALHAHGDVLAAGGPTHRWGAGLRVRC